MSRLISARKSTSSLTPARCRSTMTEPAAFPARKDIPTEPRRAIPAGVDWPGAGSYLRWRRHRAPPSTGTASIVICFLPVPIRLLDPAFIPRFRAVPRRGLSTPGPELLESQPGSDYGVKEWAGHLQPVLGQDRQVIVGIVGDLGDARVVTGRAWRLRFPVAGSRLQAGGLPGYSSPCLRLQLGRCRPDWRPSD